MMNLTQVIERLTGSSDWLSQLADSLQRISLPIVLAIGVIGNTLALTVMSLRKNQTSVMYFYLRFLAVFDNLTLIVAFLPMNLVSVFQRFAELSNVYCILTRYFGGVFYGAAMWLVVIIAVDRMIAVRFPLHATSWCTMGRARIIVIFLGVIEIGFCVPNLWRRPGHIEGSIACALNPVILWFESVAEVINSVVPVFTILILNAVIIISLRSHNRKLQLTLSANQGTKNQDGGMTMMLILVASFMIVLNLPYTFLTVTWTYIITDFTERNPNVSYVAITVVSIPAMANSSINFFLYCLASKHFRRDLRQLFHRNQYPIKSSMIQAISWGRSRSPIRRSTPLLPQVDLPRKACSAEISNLGNSIS
jgi:hypothetical protein